MNAWGYVSVRKWICDSLLSPDLKFYAHLLLHQNADFFMFPVKTTL